MLELRQPLTYFGVANETLDESIIINENRQQEADYHMMTGGLGIADYHMVTGPTKNILRQNSNNTNITNTLGRNAEHLFLKHPEPPDPFEFFNIHSVAKYQKKLKGDVAGLSVRDVRSAT